MSPLVSNGVKVDVTATDKASPVLKEVSKNIGQIEDSSKNAAQTTKEFSGESLELSTVLQGAGLALSMVTAGVAAFVAAYEAGEIAAANDRLIASGEELARQYGGSLDAILVKVTDASLGTISQLDIVSSANKAMMLGLGADANQLANLMEIAAFRGRAMGLSTTQAFDDIVRGIGRTSPMILDNLGIIIDSESNYKKYADAIGKSSSELTKQEKVQALLNSVLEEGNRQLDEAGGLSKDAATSYEKFNAELENTKNFLVEDTIQMSRFADMGADAMVSFRELADNGIGYGMDKLNAWSLLVDFAESRVRAHNEELKANAFQGIGRDSKLAKDDLYEFAQVIEGAVIPSLEELEKIEKEVQQGRANLIDLSIELTDSQEKFDKKQRETLGTIAEYEAELATLFPWELEKRNELLEKIEEQKQKYADDATSFEEASNRKIAMMTIEKIAMLDGVAGYSAAEAAKAQAVLDTLGVVEDSAARQALAFDLISSALADGTIRAHEMDQALTMMKKGYSIDVILNTIASFSGVQGLHEQSSSLAGTPLGGGYAGGGIASGPESGHWELLHGTEAVIPLQNGNIPVQLQGGAAGGGNNITVVIQIQSPITLLDQQRGAEALLQYVEQGVKTLQERGVI